LNKKIKLTRIAMRIYMHLVRSKEPLGVREIARALHLSPSTVHYHLKRLEELSLIQKEGDGYRVKEIVNPEEFVIIGRALVHRLTIYSFFFLGIDIGIVISCIIHGINIDRVITLLISSIAFVLLFIEGLNYSRRHQE